MIKIPEEIVKVVHRIEMDSRNPCRYNAAMSISFYGVAAGAMVTEREQPQIPFRIRRIICDESAFWLEDIRVGNQNEIAIAYPCRLTSDILLPDKHPIEWGMEENEYERQRAIAEEKANKERDRHGGIARQAWIRKTGLDVAQPGCNVSLTVINRARIVQSLHVIFLGDGLW